MYTVTHKNVEGAFNHLNRKVFGKALDFSSIELDIDFLDTEWGFCVPEDDGTIVLGLTNTFPSEIDFLSTLCHEMIHLLQIVKNKPVNHGKFFKDQCSRVYKKCMLDVTH